MRITYGSLGVAQGAPHIAPLRIALQQSRTPPFCRLRSARRRSGARAKPSGRSGPARLAAHAKLSMAIRAPAVIQAFAILDVCVVVVRLGPGFVCTRCLIAFWYMVYGS